MSRNNKRVQANRELKAGGSRLSPVDQELKEFFGSIHAPKEEKKMQTQTQTPKEPKAPKAAKAAEVVVEVVPTASSQVIAADAVIDSVVQPVNNVVEIVNGVEVEVVVPVVLAQDFVAAPVATAAAVEPVAVTAATPVAEVVVTTAPVTPATVAPPVVPPVVTLVPKDELPNLDATVLAVERATAMKEIGTELADILADYKRGQAERKAIADAKAAADKAEAAAKKKAA